MSLTGQKILTLAVTATALCFALLSWPSPHLSRDAAPSSLGRTTSLVTTQDAP
ncbi:hypothetical protein ABR737_39910 [Streptomyces sp. Edi2]|uniref:hypothetical protein n=1 Tax=Streptomyces sp. Edi2 TaxID=3162528 RepID=UPI00330669DA